MLKKPVQKLEHVQRHTAIKVFTTATIPKRDPIIGQRFDAVIGDGRRVKKLSRTQDVAKHGVSRRQIIASPRLESQSILTGPSNSDRKTGLLAEPQRHGEVLQSGASHPG